MRKLLITLMIGATTLALAACQSGGSPSPSLLPSEPLMPSESASPLMPSESASPLMPSPSAS